MSKPFEKVVGQFSQAMQKKLEKKARQGWSGWDVMERGDAIKRLREHLDRVEAGEVGQAVDVANFAMFIWYGEPRR
jgi:hypothetical protein